MAGRRRRRGTWFPNLGTAGIEGAVEDDDSGLFAELVIPVGSSQSSVIFITDLTFDSPVEEEALSEGANKKTLADIIGSEYILKRIVGKIFLGLDLITQTGATHPAQGVTVTCGFCVAREQDNQLGLANPSPIGASNTTEARQNYSPASVSTVREPWIWRRRWILGQAGISFGSANAFAQAQFPQTNAQYGSVMDGPHIDAKTIRRVSQDDRLWFVATARNLGGNFADPFGSVDVDIDTHIKLHLDYRLFGSLVKSRNHGAF